MSPETSLAPKPEERIAIAIHKALPLLKKEATNSPWLTALMPIEANRKTGRELNLSDSGKWILFDRDGFDMVDSLGEATVIYANLKKKRKGTMEHFVEDLEAAVQKLSASTPIYS